MHYSFLNKSKADKFNNGINADNFNNQSKHEHNMKSMIAFALQLSQSNFLNKAAMLLNQISSQWTSNCLLTSRLKPNYYLSGEMTTWAFSILKQKKTKRTSRTLFLKVQLIKYSKSSFNIKVKDYNNSGKTKGKKNNHQKQRVSQKTTLIWLILFALNIKPWLILIKFESWAHKIFKEKFFWFFGLVKSL